MQTDYKSSQGSYEIVSPFQLKNKPTYINSVVRDEIQKNIQTYNFSVEITEDIEALRAFQNIQGVVAFKATLKRGSQVYGFGYGMTVINETNKYFTKQIAFAANSALIDSVVKASKLIDVLPTNPNNQKKSKESPSSYYKIEQTNNFQPASEKQIKFLERLLRDNQAGQKEIESAHLLSKKEAAEKISFLMPQNNY